MYPATGPWRVTKKLDSRCHCLRHYLDESQTDKKYESHFYVYPEQLVPFEPVDGLDNHFSQINVPIEKTPFAEAGIYGFEPTKPF